MTLGTIAYINVRQAPPNIAVIPDLCFKRNDDVVVFSQSWDFLQMKFRTGLPRVWMGLENLSYEVCSTKLLLEQLGHLALSKNFQRNYSRN